MPRKCDVKVEICHSPEARQDLQNSLAFCIVVHRNGIMEPWNGLGWKRAQRSSRCNPGHLLLGTVMPVLDFNGNQDLGINSFRESPYNSGFKAAPSPWVIPNTLFPSPCSPAVVAFLVAFHQNKQLIGEKGLLPCKLYLQDIKKYFKGKVGLDALSYAPTLIWFLDWSAMDSTLDCLALAGLAVAAFVLLLGCANMVLMSLLWLLYLSLVNVGQIWWVLNPFALLFTSAVCGAR